MHSGESTFKYRVKLSFSFYQSSCPYKSCTHTYQNTYRFTCVPIHSISLGNRPSCYTRQPVTFLFSDIRAFEQTTIIKYDLNRSRSYSRNTVSISACTCIIYNTPARFTFHMGECLRKRDGERESIAYFSSMFPGAYVHTLMSYHLKSLRFICALSPVTK